MSDAHPRRETALDTPAAKIWRYVDMPKLVSILAMRALYFARPASFHDPYEGWMPRSHLDALAGINQSFIAQQHEFKKQVAELHPDADLAGFNAAVDANIEVYAERRKRSPAEVVQRFGVSCWHKNEHESEAMWRAYPAECVAIESTVGQLRDANRSGKAILIDNVRYMDFDNDPVEKGYSQYLLFLKRKSFEHEHEVRATVLLGDGDAGAFLDFNLDVLITQIHISPRAGAEFRQAVCDIVAGNTQPLARPVLVSNLYEKPSYGINLTTSE